MGSNPSNSWTAICPMAVCHQSPDRTVSLRVAAFCGGESPNALRLFLQLPLERTEAADVAR